MKTSAAKLCVQALQDAGGLSDESDEEVSKVVAPVLVFNTTLALCGQELCESNCAMVMESMPDEFSSFEAYEQWLHDVPAKRVRGQVALMRRPSHVTIVDAFRMEPDRRLQWVLFRVKEAGLTLAPKLEHFPPFYHILCATMQDGAPHAKFDLAKKLFAKWVTTQNPNFALPRGRIESWPIEIRCRVQSITKHLDVHICPCGKLTDDVSSAVMAASSAGARRVPHLWCHLRRVL